MSCHVMFDVDNVDRWDELLELMETTGKSVVHGVGYAAGRTNGNYWNYWVIRQNRIVVLTPDGVTKSMMPSVP